MEYNLLFAEPDEKYLYFRLGGEQAERNGAIGYMRADFGRGGNGFHTTWLDNQRHLKKLAFKSEFDKIINFLHGNIFASRKDLETFCKQHTEHHIDDRGVGFHIHTPSYSYYARCNPTTHDYDIYIFVYDNCYLIPELTGQHELPNDCYSILPSSGEIVFLVKGENGYFPCGKSTPDRELNRQFVVASNALLGVTRAQEEAMLAGSMHGWDTPAAKPWRYEPNGNMRSIPIKNKEEHER